jgi:hypothetical protein
LTRPEEEPEEEDAKHKATFLDALIWLEAARKHTFSYHISFYIYTGCSNIF